MNVIQMDQMIKRADFSRKTAQKEKLYQWLFSQRAAAVRKR